MRLWLYQREHGGKGDAAAEGKEGDDDKEGKDGDDEDEDDAKAMEY